MDNLRPATGADARAVRNLRAAMRAYQRLHAHTITPLVSEYEKFRDLLCFFDSNLSDHAGISSSQTLIP
jgi:hypothetical protein